MLIPKREFTYGSRQWGIWDTEIGNYVEIERRTPEGRFAGYVANFNTQRECQETIDQVVETSQGEESGNEEVPDAT